MTEIDVHQNAEPFEAYLHKSIAFLCGEWRIVVLWIRGVFGNAIVDRLAHAILVFARQGSDL
jgi:hypothetical protein